MVAGQIGVFWVSSYGSLYLSDMMRNMTLRIDAMRYHAICDFANSKIAQSNNF